MGLRRRLPAPPFPMATDMGAALRAQGHGTSRISTLARTAFAVAASWAAARYVLDVETPTFAPLTALYVTQRSLFSTFGLGLQTLLGVIMGLLWGAVSASVFSSTSLAIFVAILGGLAMGRFLPLGPTATGQVPVSALLMVLLGGSALAFAVERMQEAVLGGVVGILVVLVFATRLHYEDAENALSAWEATVVTGMRRTADLLRAGADTQAATTQLEQALLSQHEARDTSTNEVFVVFDAARTRVFGRGVDTDRLQRISERYQRLQIVDSQVRELGTLLIDRLGRRAMLPVPVDPAVLADVVDALLEIHRTRSVGKDATDRSRLLKRQLEVIAENASRGRSGTMGGLLAGLGVLGLLEQLRREVAEEVMPTETDLLNWSTAQIQSLRAPLRQ